jgi:hypothetical protein
MAGLYVAYNQAFTTTTNMLAGTSYASGPKVAVQLVPVSTGQIRVVEWGVSFNGSAAGTPSVCSLSLAGAATTLTTHTTSSIVPFSDNQKTSSLSMGTTTTAFGAATMATNTTAKEFDAQFVAQAGAYVKQWPLGREPVILGSQILQLRINTAATLTALAYIVFEEN